MSCQAVVHRAIIRTGGSRLIDNNKVKPEQYRLILAKRLSYNSLDTISCDRSAAVFPRDRETESRGPLFVVAKKYGEKPISAATRVFENITEFRGAAQPAYSLKLKPRAVHQS